MDSNTTINGAYHAAVISGLILTNYLLAKKLLKVEPAELGRLDIKYIPMLTESIYIATMIKKITRTK